MLNQVPCHRGIVPRILKVGALWSWVARFMPQPLYPLNKRLDEPQNRCERGDEEIYHCPDQKSNSCSMLYPDSLIPAEGKDSLFATESRLLWDLLTQGCLTLGIQWLATHHQEPKLCLMLCLHSPTHLHGLVIMHIYNAAFLGAFTTL
jgi:hypothetical protein